jgi:predicted nucleic acid-binding protein
VVFIDANVPMYLVGAPHPNRERAYAIVEALTAAQRSLITSAEVLQEVLHRYHAIRRPDAMRDALQVLLGLVEDVLPITGGDVVAAMRLLGAPESGPRSARDALHVAVMRRHGITEIVSFDRGFDAFSDIERLH